MKKLFFVLMICFMIVGSAFAQEVATTEENPIFKIELKQGMIKPYQGGTIQHLTTFASIETDKIESLGKWNALWDGWSLDAGFSYKGTTLDTGAVLIAREFGTLADYLPLKFPLARFIKLTLYPIGLRVQDPFGDFKTDKVYGLAYIKGEVSF